jgi:rRNA maturation endonuclease Nob1
MYLQEVKDLREFGRDDEMTKKCHGPGIVTDEDKGATCASCGGITAISSPQGWPYEEP